MRRATLAAALATVAAAAPANAFVRSTTKDGIAPLFWRESCVPVTIYLNGFVEKDHVGEAQVVKSIAAAAHAWGPDGVTCPGGSPSLEIVPTLSPSKTAGPTGYDARNSLVFRTDNWTPGGKADSLTPYSESALAVTTVVARADGHIVDADMEINGVSMQWANLDPGARIPIDREDRGFFDIQNTITHEFGHFIGLDHTCFNYDPMHPKIRPQDDKNQPVPDCDGSSGAVADTTMYDRSSPLETSKRTLADDDKNAVCAIYPPTAEAPACALDSPVGCSLAPPPVAPRASPRRQWAPFAALGLLAVGLVVRVRRRTRR